MEWNGRRTSINPNKHIDRKTNKYTINNKFVKQTNGFTVSLTNKQRSRQEDNLSFKTNK